MATSPRNAHGCALEYARLNRGIALVLGLAGTLIYRARKAVVRHDFDAYKLVRQEARILVDKAQRSKEQRRTAAVTQEVTNAQVRIASLEDDLRNVHVAAGGVHDAAASAVSRARASACPATASTDKSRETPLGCSLTCLTRPTNERANWRNTLIGSGLPVSAASALTTC